MRLPKRDTPTFLREAAERLRRIAQRVPEIQADLCQMADDVEAIAAELTGGQKGGGRALN